MIAKLDAAIKAVCPIHGVSIGRVNDKQTWRIDFRDEATAQERDAARAALDAFDVQAADAPPTASELIDQCFPQSGTARVLFEALFELANDVRVLKGQSQITRAQLKNWLQSKLPST